MAGLRRRSARGTASTGAVPAAFLLRSPVDVERGAQRARRLERGIAHACHGVDRAAREDHLVRQVLPEGTEPVLLVAPGVVQVEVELHEGLLQRYRIGVGAFRSPAPGRGVLAGVATRIAVVPRGKLRGE